MVAEEQGEQRRDDSRLSRTHDHLVDARLARRRRLHELVDKVGLLRAEQQIECILEREEARVVHDGAVGVGPAHEDTPRRQQLGEG